jgi:hypothetical protein
MTAPAITTLANAKLGGRVTRPADAEARARLAANAETPASVLCLLANDPDVMVRAALALNQAAPLLAADQLVQDPDDRVRALLGQRLAALCPELDDAAQRAARDHVLTMLAQLVADTAVTVRGAIATVLKDMPQAPHDLIMRLATDTETSVSNPVVQLSPVLSDDDLLTLMEAKPDRAVAVASRFGLSARLCDVVVAGADPVAIQTMLENGSATIREATLDALAVQSGAHQGWQAPLVRRPMLSSRAVRALSGVVAGQLLDSLATRADLDANLAGELRVRVQSRVAEETPGNGLEWPEQDQEPMAARRFAQHLKKLGKLDEAALVQSARRSHAQLMAAILSVAGNVSPGAVQRAATLRSSKALVSLVWQAGYSARMVVPVQVLLGQLPPVSVLVAGEDGGFPLSIEEMRWQLEFLNRGRT